MNRITLVTSTEHQSAELASQARRLRAHYPLLYDYLERRDRALERALARIPSQADVELGGVFNDLAYLETTLQSLAPGIADLNRD